MTVKGFTTHPGSAEDKHLFVQNLFNRLMFVASIERMRWLAPPSKALGDTTEYLHLLHEGYHGRGPSIIDRRSLADVVRSHHGVANGTEEPRFYDLLQLLFFSALNSINGTGGKSLLRGVLGTVPYLNGGLFMPDPRLDRTDVKVDDKAFTAILGNGGLFQKYNFTIQESTPEDIDVAVDPEMLGKIFEELVTGRHESGSYYTPRPVVSFMCREAVKSYLIENGLGRTEAINLVDEREEGVKLLGYEGIGVALRLLSKIRVVDPACGSGAYLLGMMRELYDLTQMLERRRAEADPRELYNVKLEIIQNNLYGVDIDPFAVSIARLRLWLSLAVDHKGGNPEPLPNLEYKIETGDSLVAPNPTALDSSVTGDLFRDERILEFDSLKKEYGKPATTPEEVKQKLAVKKQIDNIRAEMRGWYGTKTTAATGAFDWRIEFAEVFSPDHATETKQIGSQDNAACALGGFDVVLANPPYVRADAQFKHMLPDRDAQQKAIANWKSYRDELKRSKIYSTLHEKWDLYIPFLERAHQVLGPRGQMIFIIPDAYNGNKYAIKSHGFFLEESQIERIDFCSEIPLFSAAVYNTILHFSKQSPSLDHAPVRARRWGKRPEEFTANCDLFPLVSQGEVAERVFRPLAERNAAILEGYLPLSHVCYISKGAVLHADEKEAHELFKLGDLISDTRDNTHPKRLFLGKNMGSWTVLGNSWLEYGTTRAPALFSRPTFPELYEVPEKLVSMDLSGSRLRVVYDDGQCWHNHSAWSFVPWHSLKQVQNRSLSKVARYKNEKSGSTSISIPREDLEKLSTSFDIRYLLGLMNSSFARIWMARQRRNKMHIYPDDWKPFPVKVVTASAQAPVANVVQQILDAKKADPSADVSALESRLDSEVDFLYHHQRGDETFEEWQARMDTEAASGVGAVRELLRRGEDDTLEFKSSVIWDIRQDKYSLVMRDEVLKEICAFLNADGGTILCGVEDRGAVLGLAKDLKHSGGEDKLGLLITNAFGDLLKPNPVELVKMKFLQMDGETILRFTVTGDPKNRYESPSVKKEDEGKNIPRTHVRILSSAKALEGRDLISWWDRRRTKSIGAS